MYFHTISDLGYTTFGCLENTPVRHAVFTRRGGVSKKPWDSLNLGGTVGDDPRHVQENRLRAFTALGLEMDSLYDVWQVHSAEVVCTDKPRPAHAAHLQADAILTDRPGVTLFMRFADCVPILLFDPKRAVIGLVHAGWKGTVSRIAAQAVKTMHQRYGSSADEVLAMIGPSIGPDHYEVGQEVIQQVRTTFGSQADVLLRSHNGTPSGRMHLDLWLANQLVLSEVGVKEIEMAEICTACNLKDWYSHRAEHGQTGRFGALVCLDVE